MIKQFNNFFENPDYIRNTALGFETWPCGQHPYGGNWPGERTDYLSAITPEVFEIFWRSFYKAMEWEDEKPVHFESFFQFCKLQDGDSWVHQDIMTQGFTHVGLIYLTPNAPEHAGTTIYKPKEGKSIEDIKDKEGNIPGDHNVYDIKHEFKNIYNTCVLYSPDELHSSSAYFGDHKNNARLTLVFFAAVK